MWNRHLFSIRQYWFFWIHINKKMPTLYHIGIFITNQNQIINNHFITLQISCITERLAVKVLLLLCCTYVKFFAFKVALMKRMVILLEFSCFRAFFFFLGLGLKGDVFWVHFYKIITFFDCYKN